MKPVGLAADERARVVSARSHRTGDNLEQIPSLTNVATRAHLQNNAFDICFCINLQKQPVFTAIDIVMELCHTYTTVVAHHADDSIQFDAK